ncbi:hypothetical protein [Enterobacter cloacae]
MFNYPQGEGGQSGACCECERETLRWYDRVYSLQLPPLLSRFALRSTRLQTTVSMGGMVYGD